MGFDFIKILRIRTRITVCSREYNTQTGKQKDKSKYQGKQG